MLPERRVAAPRIHASVTSTTADTEPRQQWSGCISQPILPERRVGAPRIPCRNRQPLLSSRGSVSDVAAPLGNNSAPALVSMGQEEISDVLRPLRNALERDTDLLPVVRQ